MAAALFNYLFNRKKSTPEVATTINAETRILYLTYEFESLGDMIKDKVLRKEEFVRLMALLGYPGDLEEMEKIWNMTVDTECGRMTLEEYIALMSDDAIRSKTDTWQKLFAHLDTDGNGFATKAEVLDGLQNIGVTITPGVRAKLEVMDTNKDGKISYGEFLKQQLQQ